MLNTDPMMLERFGDHLQQHLRTQKTHFSYLHWGTLKCWCSAVHTTRCQPFSEKCLLFHVLFLYFEGNCVKMSDVWGQSCTDSHVVIWQQVAGWKTFWTQRSAFNEWCHDCSEETMSYCWEIICVTVSHEGQRGSFTSLSQITHYLYFWTGPAARSCTWVCTISLLA